MEIAKKSAKQGFKSNEGGPFGAVIVDANENIISTGNNKAVSYTHLTLPTILLV